MKWIKILQAFGDHKTIGEIISVDAKEAEFLIKNKMAEESPEPEAAKTKRAEVEEEANEMASLIASKAMSEIKKELKQLNADIKSKRPHVVVDGDNEDNDPTFGFKHVGDQIRHIKGWYAGEEDSRNDERMKRCFGHMIKAPTTYASEGTGADGGFLLAPNFSNNILAHTFEEDGLLARTDTYTTGSNSLTVPKDETTPWGTTGVQVAWTGEATQLTQSKLKLGQTNLVLNKITALVPVSDEQLQDSFVGLGNYVSTQAGQRISFAIDEAIINGNAVGKPLGIINSGALVTQAAESAQTAGTINITNLAKMISHMPATSLKKMVFLIHPSAFPQIVILTNGNQSLYIPPGGVQGMNAANGLLFGVPVIISQHCQNIGTAGDIFLLDLSKYLTLTKGDGVQSAMSIHLFFDYSVSTFRFSMRIAGTPWQTAPFTSQYGSFKTSPFVNLAAR